MRDAQAFTLMLIWKTPASAENASRRAVIDGGKRNRYTQPSLTGVSPSF